MAYFGYCLVALYLIGFVIRLAYASKGNDELTEEKIKLLLDRKTDSVLDYEIVNVETISKHRCKRHATANQQLVQFEIDKQKRSLQLAWRRRSVLNLTAPVLLITSTFNGTQNYTYQLVEEEDKVIEGVFFEDLENLATLLAYYDKKQRQMLYDGIFGLGTETHVIRSVPEKWRTVLRSSENYTNFINNRNNEHVLFKPAVSNKEARSSFLNVPDTDEEKSHLNKSIDKLHIKILPVIDYALFHLLRENVRETLKYVATFWNAVDMRFSQLNRSKIEITVTGVVIATDDQALTFVNACRNEANPTQVHAFEFLEAARMYFYEKFINDTGITNYDAIFVMTGLDTKPTTGMSYIGRICNRLYSTAFVLDDGNFFSLHAAIHELGHLMNLYHDGSDSARDCNPYPNSEVATVMAPFISEAKSIVWSNCSQRSLQEFIQTKAAKCLRETYRIK